MSVRIPDEPIITNTTVRVEGPLARAKAGRRPALPVPRTPIVLRRTVVTLSVNGDAVVETALGSRIRIERGR